MTNRTTAWVGFTHDVNLALKFQGEQQAGLKSGNRSLVTNAGLRIAVLTGRPSIVSEYLLEEMGIRAGVECDNGCLMISVQEHHSITAIMRALRGAFAFATATARDGRQALMVAAPTARPQMQIEHEPGIESSTSRGESL